MKNQNRVKEYREIYETAKDIEKTISELKTQDEPGKRDYLEYQINEINRLDIQAGETEELSEKINFIENRAKILNLGGELNTVLELLSDKAQRATDLAEDLSKLTDMEYLSDRIRSTAIELVDIYRSFSLP